MASSSRSQREGVHTLVAVGLRSLSDARGPLLQATRAPVTLACQLEARHLRCEIDGPVSVHLGPHDSAAMLRWRTPGWTGAAVTASDTHRVEADEHGWISLDPPPHVTTTMIFELTLG